MEFDIARAWKDARYRQSLTLEQQAKLPENPVGSLELTDADLEAIQGQGTHPGGENIGSNSLNDCLYSIGGGDYSCNTFAKVAASCVSGGSPGAFAQICTGLAEVIRAFHFF